MLLKMWNKAVELWVTLPLIKQVKCCLHRDGMGLHNFLVVEGRESCLPRQAYMYFFQMSYTTWYDKQYSFFKTEVPLGPYYWISW